MKGLLLKDTYVVVKQMKVFLVLMLVFALIPSKYSNMYNFSIMYATLLPVTAMAYDERSKWNILLRMMPYSDRQIVLSKYIFGYICCLVTAVFVCIAQSVVSLIMKTPISAEIYLSIFLITCGALMIEAIYLPIVFKFGVEKGRMAVIIVVVILIIGGVSLSSGIMNLATKADKFLSPLALLGIGVAIMIALNVLSVEISARLKRAD